MLLKHANCAHSDSVCSDRRRARMESPWYVRQLSGCELDEGAQFDCVQIPCVVSPAPDGKCLPEATRATAQNRKVAPEVVRESGRKRHVLDSQPAPHEVVALDIRQAIVALLVATTSSPCAIFGSRIQRNSTRVFFVPGTLN